MSSSSSSNKVFAVMYHNLESSKAYDVATPSLFYNLEDALKDVEEFVEEQNSELEGNTKNPGYFTYHLDLAQLRIEGLPSTFKNFIAYSNDQTAYLWIDVIKIKGVRSHKLEYVFSEAYGPQDV